MPFKTKCIIIWTASSEFGTYRICEQRRFRRACASAQSRQNLRCSLTQAVSQEEPSDRKPDPWPLWMAGHAQLKFVMTECSKTQIRLTDLIWYLQHLQDTLLMFYYIRTHASFAVKVTDCRASADISVRVRGGGLVTKILLLFKKRSFVNKLEDKLEDAVSIWAGTWEKGSKRSAVCVFSNAHDQLSSGPDLGLKSLCGCSPEPSHFAYVTSTLFTSWLL